MNYIYIYTHIYCIILYIYCILQNSLLATSVDIISISSASFWCPKTTSLGSPAKIRAPSHKSHKSSTDGWFYMFNMFPIYIYIYISIPSTIRNVMFHPGFKVLKEVRDVRDVSAKLERRWWISGDHPWINSDLEGLIGTYTCLTRIHDQLEWQSIFWLNR